MPGEQRDGLLQRLQTTYLVRDLHSVMVGVNLFVHVFIVLPNASVEVARIPPHKCVVVL